MTNTQDTTEHIQTDQDGHEVTVTIRPDGTAMFTRDGKRVSKNSIDYWRLEAERVRIAQAKETAEMQALVEQLRADVDATQQRVKRTRKPLNVSIFADTRQRAKAFSDTNDVTLWELVDTALNEYLDRNERGEQQAIDGGVI